MPHSDAFQKACVILNRLSVQVIDDTSGLFIGTNYAVGWSSTSKSNQGFGSLRDATASQLVNAVFDSDWIDAPVYSSKHINTVKPNAGEGSQCSIAFQTLNVNSIGTGSTIDVGDNQVNGWNSSHKSNYGTGKTTGSNRLQQIANYVSDNDGIDAAVRTEGVRVQIQSD